MVFLQEFQTIACLRRRLGKWFGRGGFERDKLNAINEGVHFSGSEIAAQKRILPEIACKGEEKRVAC
jgi:hypothetical protein